MRPLLCWDRADALSCRRHVASGRLREKSIETPVGHFYIDWKSCSANALPNSVEHAVNESEKIGQQYIRSTAACGSMWVAGRKRK